MDRDLIEDFTNEQENQVTAVYEAVENLIAVMVPDCKRLYDIAFVGPVADMVSEYLQSQGQVVQFPEIVSDDTGFSYVEESVAQCRECKRETSDVLGDNDARYIINDGYEGQFVVCFSCHRELMERGEYTSCEACGSYFEGDYLRDNPANGVRELCPYCHEVWCE